MQRINQQAVRLLAGVFVWPRHWLSWVVGVVMTAAMVIIVVPAEFNYTGKNESLAHGWPLVWLHRDVNDPRQLGLSINVTTNWEPRLRYPWRGIPVLWTAPVAWPVTNAYEQIRWALLAIDILLASLFVMGSTQAVERWLRSRGGYLRFRLVELLAAMMIAALLGGWWSRHALLQQEEIQAYREIAELDSTEFPSSDSVRGHWEYKGPNWFAKLAGCREWLTFARHCDSIELAFDHVTLENLEALRAFLYLKQLVVIDRPFTREEIKRSNGGPLFLYDLFRLEHKLQKQMLDTGALATALRRVPKSLSVRVELSGLYREDIEDLCRAPPVTCVDVAGAFITHNDLRKLREQYPGVAFFDDGLERCSARDVAVFRLMDWGCDDEVIEWLERSGELNLAQVTLTKRRLDHLTPLQPEVESIVLDKGSDVDAVIEFAGRCANFYKIDCRAIDLTAEQLSKTVKAAKGESFIRINQGRLTCDELLQAIGSAGDSVGLAIYKATLSPREVQRLRDGVAAWVVAYAEPDDGPPDWPEPLPGLPRDKSHAGSDPADDPFGGDDPS